jgi:adenosylcobinamide kinase / adenosylcobinamide-phosphate guanylyltransferase
LAASLAAGPASPGLPRLTLVIGGARSGKSAWAEAAIMAAGAPAYYLATATAGDAEMAERIRHHQARRGAFWTTVEEQMDLAARLRDIGRPVLVDCLTLWLTNLLLADRPVERECEALAAALQQLPGPIVLVANEVGFGIVPDNALARRFRDAAGRLNQAVAAIADRVVLLVAGVPLTLKDKP